MRGGPGWQAGRAGAARLGQAALRRVALDLAVVAAAMAVAVLSRKYLLSALETRIVWVTFYPAVMIVALMRGWLAGVVSAVAACLLAVHGWSLMAEAPFIKDQGDRLGMFAFLFNGGMIALVAEMARRAREHALRAQAEAETANRAKTVFLASMSHELRTPLNAILGFAHLLERDPAATADQRARLGIIRKSGEHLLAIINAVLDLAKVESGRIEFEPVDFALREQLDAVVSLLRVRAQAKGLELVLAQSGDLPRWVRSDSTKLRQALINLVGNAIKFTPAGRVTLRVAAEPGKDGALVLAFAVIDTGPGIAVDDRERIFQPFVQLGRSEGTGLGLAIAQQYIQMLGGIITLDSVLGQGSTFRFSIPVTPVEAPVSVPATDAGEVSAVEGAAGLRILIVEDQAENRQLLRGLLQPWGFQLREAEDGASGVQAWRDWRPQLIFMDRRMPVLDGLAATRQIRALAAGQGDPPIIVAVTAHAFRDERQEMLDAGCDAFLAKPYAPGEPLAILARFLPVRLSRGDAASADPPADMSLAGLASLPEDLRGELATAMTCLDAARIERLIGRIATSDPVLGRALAVHAGDFDYRPIQAALARI